MTKFTKEQLQEIAQTDHVQCGDAAAMARQLLAGLEQEPVAYYFPGGEREIEQVSLPDDIDDGQKANCIPLYAAPQLPQPAVEALKRLRSIVADPKTLPRRKEWISGQQYSYVLLESVEAMVDDACRAAMLQGAEPVSQPVIDEHVRREYRVEGSPWIQCSKEAYDRRKVAGYEVRELYERPQNSPQNIPGNIPAGWVAVPVEPTQEMLDSYEHDAMPAVFIDSMRERARMSRRHSWRAFLRAAPKLEVAQPPQSESQDSTVTVYPWLVSLMVLDKDLREFIPYCFYILKNNDGLLTRSDFESLLKEQVKEHIGDRNYTITFFGKVDPYQAPQQEVK